MNDLYLFEREREREMKCISKVVMGDTFSILYPFSKALILATSLWWLVLFKKDLSSFLWDVNEETCMVIIHMHNLGMGLPLFLPPFQICVLTTTLQITQITLLWKSMAGSMGGRVAWVLLVLEFFLCVVYIDSTKVALVDLHGELCCILFSKCELGFFFLNYHPLVFIHFRNQGFWRLSID